MKILFFCPRWGQDDLPWQGFLEKAKLAGYDGVEVSLPAEKQEIELMLNGLAEHNLLLIGQHWEIIAKGFKEHKKEYDEKIRNLAAVKPLFINSQTGKDYYSFQQNMELIQIAELVSKDTGIPVFHETHRGKFSFAAHITQNYFQHLPDLKITLDISHWCTVAETFLEDQSEAIELAVSRTEHLHSRVGYQQGPQITDPRAPEWNEALQFHLGCWDRVIELQRKSLTKNFTITCEFGPAPYMPLLPFTKMPISDQWEVNAYMMDLLKRRYNPKVIKSGGNYYPREILCSSREISQNND